METGRWYAHWQKQIQVLCPCFGHITAHTQLSTKWSLLSNSLTPPLPLHWSLPLLPCRFRSLHCYLYPSEKQCIKRVRSIIPWQTPSLRSTPHHQCIYHGTITEQSYQHFQGVAINMGRGYNNQHTGHHFYIIIRVGPWVSRKNIIIIIRSTLARF